MFTVWRFPRRDGPPDPLPARPPEPARRIRWRDASVPCRSSPSPSCGGALAALALSFAARSDVRAVARDRSHHRHDRRDQRGGGCRRPDRRAARRAVPGADRGLRRSGAADQRRHLGESECPAAGPGNGRGAGAVRAPLPAARDPGPPQGQLRHRGHSHHRGVLPAAGFAAPGRCLRGAEAAGGRRHRAGQGEPERVRLRGRHEFARRNHPEPARSHPHPRRLFRRHRRGGGGRRTALSGWVRTPGARSAAPPRRTGWRASNRRSGS